MTTPYDWLAKIYTNCSGHMTKIATMPIYGKNSLNIFYSGNKTRVGISGTTAKSRQRIFVPSSHTGPVVVVALSQKSQTKVGTLACFDFL